MAWYEEAGGDTGMTVIIPSARLQDVADLNPSLDAIPEADEIVSFLRE